MHIHFFPENDLYDLSPFPVFVFIKRSRVRIYEITANHIYKVNPYSIIELIRGYNFSVLYLAYMKCFCSSA